MEDKETFEFNKNGQQIDLDLSTSLKRAQRKSASFEDQGLLDHIAEVHQGGIFIDVGAKEGNHSVYFAKFAADFVISFEPVAECFRVFKKNLEKNQVQNKVTAFNLAVGSKVSKGKMELSDEGLFQFRVDPFADTTMLRLDDIPDLFDTPVSLIRIDAAGLELDALKGCKHLLRRSHPVLFVYIKDDQQAEDIFEYLLNFDYRLVERHKDGQVLEFI